MRFLGHLRSQVPAWRGLKVQRQKVLTKNCNGRLGRERRVHDLRSDGALNHPKLGEYDVPMIQILP
jgi:hypothetical protein